MCRPDDFPPYLIAPAAVCARGGCAHPYSDHEPMDPDAPCYHGAHVDICLCTAFVLGPAPRHITAPDDSPRMEA